MAGLDWDMRFFDGGWTLRREISRHGRMRGEARFHRYCDDWLEFVEEGVATLQMAREVAFFRRYIYNVNLNGFDVYFNDRPLRLFERVNLVVDKDGLRGSASHKCAEDIYDSTYNIFSTDKFMVIHRVAGPRKDYVIETTFQRIIL